MELHALAQLRHAVVSSAVAAFLLGSAVAGAQVTTPGNSKPLPPSAQKAPPFQQNGGGGGGGGGQTGPRIVHGSFVTNPDGQTYAYSGYSVACSAAGSGGTSFPVQVTAFTSVVTGTFPSTLLPGQFILIDGQFFRVFGFASPSAIEIGPMFTGTSGSHSATIGMLLFTTCNVVFDAPFASAPSIVITSRGNQPMPPETFNPDAIVAQIEQGAGLTSNDRFQFFLMQPNQTPFMPGNTSTADFIAIGN